MIDLEQTIADLIRRKNDNEPSDLARLVIPSRRAPGFIDNRPTVNFLKKIF
jgi:hypothetical protein